MCPARRLCRLTVIIVVIAAMLTVFMVTAAPMRIVVDVRYKAWATIWVIAAIPRRINADVPAFLYKIDRIIAGIVISAILGPVLIVGRRNTQVNRLVHDARWCWLRHYRG